MQLNDRGRKADGTNKFRAFIFTFSYTIFLFINSLHQFIWTFCVYVLMIITKFCVPFHLLCEERNNLYNFFLYVPGGLVCRDGWTDNTSEAIQACN